MKDLINKITDFVNERDWDQFHTPRNLAISIVLEASELLEKFQWKKDDDLNEKEIMELKEEIADVFIYLLLISKKLNIDLLEATEDKLIKNAQKYPIDKAKGKSNKYTEL